MNILFKSVIAIRFFSFKQSDPENVFKELYKLRIYTLGLFHKGHKGPFRRGVLFRGAWASAPKGNAQVVTNSILMSEFQRFYSTSSYSLMYLFVVNEVEAVVSELTMFSVR